MTRPPWSALLLPGPGALARGRRQPASDNGGKPAGSDKVRDILRRNPGMPKAEVAKRAEVSVRTVERVLGAAKNMTAA
jgi:hypothetical protein